MELLNLDEAAFNLVYTNELNIQANIEQLYAKLYPFILRDFRHAMDCNIAHQVVDKHIHQADGPTSPPLTHNIFLLPPSLSYEDPSQLPTLSTASGSTVMLDPMSQMPIKAGVIDKRAPLVSIL